MKATQRARAHAVHLHCIYEKSTTETEQGMPPPVQHRKVKAPAFINARGRRLSNPDRPTAQAHVPRIILPPKFPV